MQIIDFSGGAASRENCQTLITCEGDVADIKCPASMNIYIIDGFYGRKDRNV